MAAHRGWLYDRLVAGMTSGWYREVLTRLPRGTRLLDVGIGTGAALVRCADLVRERQLSIVGIDVDADYLARCERAVNSCNIFSFCWSSSRRARSLSHISSWSRRMFATPFFKALKAGVEMCGNGRLS